MAMMSPLSPLQIRSFHAIFHFLLPLITLCSRPNCNPSSHSSFARVLFIIHLLSQQYFVTNDRWLHARLVLQVQNWKVQSQMDKALNQRDTLVLVGLGLAVLLVGVGTYCFYNLRRNRADACRAAAKANLNQPKHVRFDPRLELD